MCVCVGGGGWGGMVICICVTESLPCSPETTTTWLIDYIPIQNVSGVKKKKIQAPAEGIRRVSHLLSHISEAEFKATAGEISWRDSPFPAHLSQWKRDRTPFPLPRQEVHKGREGLLLKEATASEVVALTTRFGGASGSLFILRLFSFLKSWNMSDLQKRKISLCGLKK